MKMIENYLVVLILAVCLCSACTKNEMNRSDEACAQKVKALHTWLGSMVEDERWSLGGGGGFSYDLDWSPNLNFVEIDRKVGVPREDSPVIELTTKEPNHTVFTLGGLSLEEGELADELDLIKKKFMTLHPDKPFGGIVSIFVDRGVPWKSVVAVTEAVVGSGYRFGLFIFQPKGGRSAPKPPGSSIDKEIRQLYKHPSNFERVFDKIVGKCDALKSFFKNLRKKNINKEKPVPFFQYCLQNMPEAITTCGCDLDIVALQSFLWGIRPIPMVALKVELASKNAKDVKLVEAGADLPWSTTHASLLNALTTHQTAPIKLTVKIQ
jgi:hypothetical protein